MNHQIVQLTESLVVLPSRSMHYNAGGFARGGACILIDPGPHPDEVARAASVAAAEIRSRLDGDRAYLDALRQGVEGVVRAGGSVEEAVASCAALAIRHPEENAEPHRLNVESVYIELGGAADPDRVGWAQKDLIDE